MASDGEPFKKKFPERFKNAVKENAASGIIE
jgi:hypothetical protein